MRHSIPTQPGFMYDEAVRFVDAMKAAKIDANITVGGVAAYPKDESEVQTMMSICKAFDVVCDEGLTFREEDMIYRKKTWTVKVEVESDICPFIQVISHENFCINPKRKEMTTLCNKNNCPSRG